MRASLIALLLSAPAFAQADRDEELVATLGGHIRELKAVLGLSGQQEKSLSDLFTSLVKDVEAYRVKMRDKGRDAVKPEYETWQSKAREGVRGLLQQAQIVKYDQYVQRKRVLANEYEKALFGFPPVTELELRLGLQEEVAAAMHKAADAAVEAVRQEVKQQKAKSATQADLAKAINEHRKKGIERMLEAAAGPFQPKVKQYFKEYLRTPIDKLSKADRARVDRTLKGLEIKESDREAQARRHIAAIFMHRAENDALRRGMGKELLILVLTKRNEAEMWMRMNQYKALTRIHDRRLKDLYGDALSLFTSPEIAKLAAEGVIE